MRKSTIGTVIGASLIAVVGFTGAADASHLIGSLQIRNNSIRSVDIHDGTIKPRDLSAPLLAGVQGPKGDKGASGLTGAYYSVAFYDVGDTNAGAIATVACKATTDVAISGGVQVLGLDAGANARNTPVSSSFPGRMDWSTNTPKAGRLDGWVVQFGGGSIAPEKVKVYALCVPGAVVPVEQTFTQSAG